MPTINRTKEQYWKYSLISIIILLGVIIFREFLPFMGGLLGALTIYALVRNQMKYLTEKRKINNSIAAVFILIEVTLCFLVPAFFMVWLIIEQLQKLDLNPNLIITETQHLIVLIQDKTGYDILSSNNLTRVSAFLTKFLQGIIGEISSFIINSIVLIFMLYFMLVGRKQMESYIYDLLPFNEINKREVVSEVNILVRSNAIGIPLLAIIQGAVAIIGYIIFGAPNPFIFGLLTCFATIIPLLGTSLVWFPLSAYLAINGDWGNAIGLALYSLIILSNIDNLIRFLLQKKMADTHPLITVFGVIIGLTLFGFWGVIFGPLLLSMFILCLNIFKKEYLKN